MFKRSLLKFTWTASHPFNSSTTANSADVVTSLKVELERCLVSNKQKRSEVNDLKEEVRKAKKDMLEFKQRCEQAELLSHEHKVRWILGSVAETGITYINNKKFKYFVIPYFLKV